MIPRQKQFPYEAFALIVDDKPVKVTIVREQRSLNGAFQYQIADDGRMLRLDWLYPSAETALQTVIDNLTTELERSTAWVRRSRQALQKAKRRLNRLQQKK